MEDIGYLGAIFGPFMTIIGAWMLLYSETLVTIWRAVKNSPALLYYSSILNLLLGLILMSLYALWDWNLCVTITLLGWAMTIRGAMGLFLPQMFMKLCLGNPKFAKFSGFIPLVWGLALLWIGFFIS